MRRFRRAAGKYRTRKQSLARLPGVDIFCPHRSEHHVPKSEQWTTIDSLKSLSQRDPTISMWPSYSTTDINILLPQSRTTLLNFNNSLK